MNTSYVEWLQLVVALGGAAFNTWRLFDAYLSMRAAIDAQEDYDAERSALATHLLKQCAAVLLSSALLIAVGIVSVTVEATETRIVTVRYLLIGITITLAYKAVMDRRVRRHLTDRWIQRVEADRRHAQQSIPFPDRRS